MNKEEKDEERKKTSLIEKVDDMTTKGLQINICYQSDWNEMTNSFKEYRVPLMKHGPIITINEIKNVRCAKSLVEKIKDNPKFRELAAVGLGADESDYEKAIKGRLFIAFLRVIPEYCRQKALSDFENLITNGSSDEFLAKLFSTHGTIKDTDKIIDKIISDVIKNEK